MTRASEDLSQKMLRFFVFFLSLVTSDPKFELWQNFCTVHLTATFHHPMFNRLEVISWQTNLPTDKQTDATETSTSLRYARPVGNYMSPQRQYRYDHYFILFLMIIIIIIIIIIIPWHYY